MKNKYIIIAILLIGISITPSCKKYIDEKINLDPNNPEDVSMNVVLPSVEASLGYSYGSDLSRYPSLWIQTMSGLANQHLLYDNYILAETDVNNMWYFNLYGGAMSDLSVIINKATETGSPHYGGVAKILMANALGTCTDLWGDIPYSEAFKGLENLKPKYDSQEQIYASIQALLDEGIADLAAATSNFFPAGDDLVYGGDLAAWTNFAHALKARYYLHLGKRDPSNYAKALTEVANSGFSGNGDNATLNFGAVSNENNPLFQFFSNDRPGDAGMGATLVDIMNSNYDPRRALYFAPDGSCDPDTCYSGSPAGSGSGASDLGPFYNTETAPTFFMTYSELKFIEAECAFRGGDPVAAAAAFNEGVTASLDLYGASDDVGFLAANASETDVTITLDKIFTQKYVHMFTQGYEGFTDWRRSCDATHPTGIPSLTPAVSNNTGGVIARRFPYPDSERLQNGDNLNAAISNQGGALVTNRVWWDVP